MAEWDRGGWWDEGAFDLDGRLFLWRSWVSGLGISAIRRLVLRHGSWWFVSIPRQLGMKTKKNKKTQAREHGLEGFLIGRFWLSSPSSRAGGFPLAHSWLRSWVIGGSNLGQRTWRDPSSVIGTTRLHRQLTLYSGEDSFCRDIRVPVWEDFVCQGTGVFVWRISFVG